MINKLSNCFARASPSTSDLFRHVRRNKRRATDKDFHITSYAIFKRSGCADVKINFKTGG